MFRLTTVRQKLTVLVALSTVAAFAALGVLFWVMNRQLIDEVDDRIPAAIRGFTLEITDDQHDLEAMVHALSRSAGLEAALRAGDKAAAVAEGAPFHAAYPDVDFIVYDSEGRIFASLGVDTPAATVTALDDQIGGRATTTTDFRGVTSHGCEAAAAAPLAYVIARRIADVGLVVACTPLDADYLKNASDKLGVELALIGPDGRRVRTAGFLETAARAHPALGAVVDGDGLRVWKQA